MTEEDGEVLPSRGLVLVVIQESIHRVCGKRGMVIKEQALETVRKASAHPLRFVDGDQMWGCPSCAVCETVFAFPACMVLESSNLLFFL